MKNLRYILSLTVIAVSAASHAEIRLPDIVGDRMVLQQLTDARLWGWSNPGESVTVTPDWGAPTTVKADDSGLWEAAVATPAADYTPRTITISDSDSRVTVSDILIGEVWFCSGQSNMEMPVKGYPGQPIEGALEAIATAGTRPGVRMANIARCRSYEPQQTVEGNWLESTPANVANFSALGYFFACRLNEILGVPVGIINSSYGGSKVEGWIPRWKLDEYPEFDVEKEMNTPDSILSNWSRANVMYNAMLHPLTRYTIKGFAWNQGESNVGRHNVYHHHLADMVRIWRDEWGLGDIPFYSVELPAWYYNDPDGTSAALLRESQHKSAEIIPNSRVVSTVDLIYPREYYDIHGSRKREIGDRLAYTALNLTYGIKGIPCDFPAYKSMTVDGNEAELEFYNSGVGLTPNRDMQGFEAAGADGVFHPATAGQGRNASTIRVKCDSVDRIEHVRYCFKNFAIGEVRSNLGLPLVPFRTDNFEK